uniref:Glutaredoxin-related protein 5, mitochondrial n=1 Tax=Athene cunicularia TaxID=194338 RepID=A0A663M3S6_ATHCN
MDPAAVDLHALLQVLGKKPASAQELKQSWLGTGPLAEHVPNSALPWLIPGSSARLPAPADPHPVVVFMKGSPAQPLCGFSNAVVQILRLHGVEDYRAHDVLQDPDLRQGIKNYSNWPTIPQVYLNGEFVGGCDILLQMHQNGDLVEELKKLGIRSALLDAEKDQDKK